MARSLKARRFTMLQIIFAATVFLMIAKAVALRNHLVINDWSSRALGAQPNELDDQTGDDEGETLAHDGDVGAIQGE